MVEAPRLRREATELLRRLISCDTSNPPGREAQAAAVVEEHVGRAGLECERVAADPDRPNLLVRLRGSGRGPSLAFLGHLDVVAARREDWSVDPFAGVERDGAVWGRGAVDMKSQVAATAVALAALARDGFRPAGDVLLLLMADEEVGDAGVGAPYFVEQRPDLCPDYVVGEGAGERIPTSAGPIYLLDCGVKATSSASLTVRGTAGDASLPGIGSNALCEAARLLLRLSEHRPAVRVLPEVDRLLSTVAPGGQTPEARVDLARRAHPALEEIVSGLVSSVIRPTVAEANGPANVVPELTEISLQCLVLPGTTRAELEHELRTAFGEGRYDLEVEDPQGGSTSPSDSRLRDAIESFLARHDAEATLVPALAYGFSDCHFMREAYGSITYGFVPFRHADPMTNLTTKHGVDERVLVDDLEFQVAAALHLARTIGGDAVS